MRLVTDTFRCPSVLTEKEAMGLMRVSLHTLKRRLREEVGDAGTFRGDHNKKMIHSWAVAKMMNMYDKCPGCNRPWDWFPEPDDDREYRRKVLG